MSLKIEDYKAKDGWLAESGEGYKRRPTMLRVVRNMIKALVEGDYGYTADD